MITKLLFLYCVRNKFSFLVVGHRTHQFYFFARRIFGPQHLRNLSFIVFDYFVGDIQYALGAAIVLLQLHHLHILIIFLKLQDILDSCATKTVNALRIIPDDANIFMLCSQ